MLIFSLFFVFSFCQEIGHLMLLTNDNGAACLDGSPPAYYYAKGTGSGANNWYIHHEGGGWCNTINDCYQRSLGNLGSTTKLGLTMNFSKQGAYFSPDPKVNSLMYNWNKVFLAYCDGGSFAGNNQTVTSYNGASLYFRGFRNLNAYQQDLWSRNLNKAVHVVISGCSAGGLATYLHLDWWREHFSTATHVIGLPDSGFFLDYESSPRYAAKMRWVFDQQNATAGVNQLCIRHNAKEVQKCMFAEHTAPHIRTNYFPMQSAYDTWQISNVLGSNDPGRVNEFGRLLKERFIASVIKNKRNGAFLDSCAHHCGKWNEIVINNKDIDQAFHQYFFNPVAGQFYNQDMQYPCDRCCHK